MIAAIYGRKSTAHLERAEPDKPCRVPRGHVRRRRGLRGHPHQDPSADWMSCATAGIETIGQGFSSLSAPARELEKLVVAQALRHGGHPVLRWCAANCVVEQDAAGNLKPPKRKSTERIDGIVALVMALARAMLQP